MTINSHIILTRAFGNKAEIEVPAQDIISITQNRSAAGIDFSFVVLGDKSYSVQECPLTIQGLISEAAQKPLKPIPFIELPAQLRPDIADQLNRVLYPERKACPNYSEWHRGMNGGF